MEETLQRLAGGPDPRELAGILDEDEVDRMEEAIEDLRGAGSIAVGPRPRRLRGRRAPGMILDTSYVLDLVRREETAFRKGVELHESGTIRRVPAPVRFETFYGAAFLDDSDERRRIRNELMGYPTVAIDDEMARFAGELLARTDRNEGGGTAASK